MTPHAADKAPKHGFAHANYCDVLPEYSYMVKLGCVFCDRLLYVCS
jgi:hypothetical protein